MLTRSLIVWPPWTAFSKCSAVTCFRQMLSGWGVRFVTLHEGIVLESPVTTESSAVANLQLPVDSTTFNAL